MVNIPARITARKVVYSYIYSYIVKNNPYENPTWDTVLVDKTGIPDEDLSTKVESMSKNEIVDYCIKLVQSFFSYKRTPEVDMDYVKKMVVGIEKTMKIIGETVNKYTQTFTFDKMDVSDQALFILALTEKEQVGSPKEVIINEMVELGKRYGDKGSPKLVNGVLHKMLDGSKDDKKKA